MAWLLIFTSPFLFFHGLFPSCFCMHIYILCISHHILHSWFFFILFPHMTHHGLFFAWFLSSSHGSFCIWYIWPFSFMNYRKETFSPSVWCLTSKCSQCLPLLCPNDVVRNLWRCSFAASFANQLRWGTHPPFSALNLQVSPVLVQSFDYCYFF